MTTPYPDRKRLASTFIMLAGLKGQPRTHQGYYAQLGRTYGLTDQQIADAYGTTEQDVNRLIERNTDQWHETGPTFA